MISTKLPLSTKILLVLNPSIISIITNGSSWGYFTPLASSSENRISWSFRLCSRGGILWTLFTYLWYDFLRDLNDPPVDGPPMIVFISPMALGGRRGMWSSSLWEASHWSLLPSLDLLKSPFFTNFCNFSFCISSSICSSCLCNPLCNVHDPYGNSNIFSCHARWVTSVTA